jgi:hypothetical protein
MIVVATQLVLDSWTSINFLGETIMSTGLSYVMAYGLCIGLSVSYSVDAGVKVIDMGWPGLQFFRRKS